MKRAFWMLTAAWAVGAIVVACASGEPRTTGSGDDDDDDGDASSFTQPDGRARSDASSGSSSGASSSSSSSGGSGSSSSSGGSSSSGSSSSSGGSSSSGSSSSSSSGGSSGSTFVAPVCDGVINAGEYGPNNMAANDARQWSMTWNDTSLYLGLANAVVGEAAILYLDAGGGAAPGGGSTVGHTHDGQQPGTLPFAADLVTFMKNDYQEFRTANGAGGWSEPPTTVGLGFCVADGNDNTREMVIPWSAVGGRPASFSFLLYVTSAGGFVYGELPLGNPVGNIGLGTATFPKLFSVADAAAVPTPFAVSN